MGGEVGLAGAADTEAATIADGLATWQERRSTEMRAKETALVEWRELQTLLDGQSPLDLQLEATRLAELAAERASGLDPRAIARPSHRSGRTRIAGSPSWTRRRASAGPRPTCWPVGSRRWSMA